jgi:putative Mg2+ transporter-C (MgtC) family protein
MDLFETFVRLGLTFLFSLLFGVSRQYLHKPVGFGTFIFVSVGSCALAITALNLNPDNPLPLLSAIVTGIGFLGAGALIKPTADKIFGFTNAASIWLFAVFGMVIGVGEYALAAIIYLMVIVSIVLDLCLENIGLGSYQRKLYLTTNLLIDKETVNAALGLDRGNNRLLLMEVDKAKSRVCFTYILRGTRRDLNQVGHLLYSTEWVESYHIE